MAPQSVPGAEQMTGRAPQPFGSYPFFVAPGKRAATPLQTARGSFEDSRQRRLYFTASGHPTPEGVRHRRVAMSPIGVGGWAPEARYWVCGFEACDGFETISRGRGIHIFIPVVSHFTFPYISHGIISGHG